MNGCFTLFVCRLRQEPTNVREEDEACFVGCDEFKAKSGSHPRQKRRGCVAPRRMWTQHSRYVQQSINSTASEEHTTLTILDKKTALSPKCAQTHLQQCQYQFFHWKNPLQSVIASTAAGEKTRLTRGGWKRRGWVEGREDPCTQR